MKSKKKEGMTETTSPYLDFANNLRALTARKSSIAQVCRDLGMNRQQFNKYLSGTTFPAPPTLQKISDYFGVDKRSMFEPRTNRQSIVKWDELDPLSVLGQIDSQILGTLVSSLSSSAETQFREGCYVVYHPWLQVPTDIIRAVMVVFKVGNITCFRRYTKLKIKGQARVRSTHSRHEGIVIENSGRVFLLAKNSRGISEISLQSFGASTTVSNDMIAGLALVSTPWSEPLATRVTIDYYGPKSAFKSALKLCGLVPDGSADVSETIRKSVLDPINFHGAQLLPFEIFDILRPRTAAKR